MNGKLAKKLRKQARAMTQGQANVSYETKGHVFVDKHGQRHRRTSVMLSELCTRKVYQNLKRGVS